MAFPLALETFIENLITRLWAIFTALNDWLNVAYSFFFFAVSVSQPNKRDDNIRMHIEIGLRLWNGAWLSQANEFKVVQLADGDILLGIGDFNLPDVICLVCQKSLVQLQMNILTSIYLSLPFLNFRTSNIKNWYFSSTWRFPFLV